MDITRQYYFRQDACSDKDYVSGTVNFVSEISDSGYSLGKTIQRSDISTIINNNVKNGQLRGSKNDVILFLVSDDVTETAQDGSGSFMKNYCAYHGFYDLSNGNRVYSVVSGSHARNLPTCACASASNTVSSPNGDSGIDSMISFLAPEIASVITNPDQITGKFSWNDNDGDDIAQKCATSCPNAVQKSGYWYNVGWNKRNFLLRGNWDITSSPQQCAVAASNADNASKICEKKSVVQLQLKNQLLRL